MIAELLALATWTTEVSMLDDRANLTDTEMCDFWWSRLTDEERSYWMAAAQSVDASDAWEAYKMRMAEV